MQLCRISGLHCEVAEKQTDLASALQACGDRACLIRPVPTFKGRDYLVKHCEHPRRRDDHLVGQCDQVLVVSRIDQVDLGALLDDLAQALRQQGMVLAQKGSEHQHAIELIKLGHPHAQPRHHGFTLIGGKIRLPQAMVDVLATQAAHQLLREVHFFQCRMGRCQQTDRGGAVPRTDVSQAFGHEFKRHLPLNLDPRPTLLDHRARQTRVRIEGLV